MINQFMLLLTKWSTFLLITIIIFFIIKFILLVNELLLYLISFYLQLMLKVYSIVYKWFISLTIKYINHKIFDDHFSNETTKFYFLSLIRIPFFLLISYINLNIFVFFIYNYLYINLILSVCFIISFNLEKSFICFKKSFLLFCILYYIGWYCFLLLINWNLLINFINFFLEKLNSINETNSFKLLVFLFECMYLFSLNELIRPYYFKCVETEEFVHKSIFEYSVSKINFFFSIFIFLLLSTIYTWFNIKNIHIINIDLITYFLYYINIIKTDQINQNHRTLFWNYITSLFLDWYYYFAMILFDYIPYNIIIKICIWLTLLIFLKILI